MILLLIYSIAKLEEKYFGYVNSFDFVDTRAFIRALDKKLPKWQPLFEKYAGDFDWRLIAAVSYQESHWNPKAVSPTGVKGMMMLTRPTAKSVGVTNRLDPEQSIRGGAAYLEKVLNRVPESIESHEKIWFALASYNIGFGHMMDARRLTKSQGGNPDRWSDVKQRFPLLHQAKYYKQTRYGYARGREAVNYVENIRRYYHSITGWQNKKDSANTRQPESSVDDLQTINASPSEEYQSSTQEVTGIEEKSAIKDNSNTRGLNKE